MGASGRLAIESVPHALWAVGGADSFESAVLRAVRLGGDTDTTAAMAGAIAGAVFGAAEIPRAWLAALEPGVVARARYAVARLLASA